LHHNFGYPSYKGCPTPANTTEIREKKKILCTLTNADALSHEWLAPASKRNVKEMCEKVGGNAAGKKKRNRASNQPARGNHRNMREY
jgi:hypothetical protein